MLPPSNISLSARFQRYGVVGGVRVPDYGVFSEYVVVDRDQVILTPPHLTDVQIAAWPVAGITAWRAIKIHGNVQKGQNVLIVSLECSPLYLGLRKSY